MPVRNEFQLDERAANAVAILNNALLQEVIAEMRRQYTDSMVASEPGSKEAFEAHAMVKAVDMFITQLQGVINDHKMMKHKGTVYGR